MGLRVGTSQLLFQGRQMFVRNPVRDKECGCYCLSEHPECSGCPLRSLGITLCNKRCGEESSSSTCSASGRYVTFVLFCWPEPTVHNTVRRNKVHCIGYLARDSNYPGIIRVTLLDVLFLALCFAKLFIIFERILTVSLWDMGAP